MRRLICSIIIGVLGFMMFGTNVVNGENLIVNPGFEEGNNGWGFKQAEVVSSDAHTGKYCVRVAGGDYNAAFQDITIEKGKKYRLSGYIKVPSGTNVFWLVVISDSQGWIKEASRQGKKKLPSWTKIEQLHPYQPITFTANESTVRVTLWNRKGSSEDAVVYFDDIVLELDTGENVVDSNNEIKAPARVTARSKKDLNVALWAPRVEYQPGELLLLRPALPEVNMDGVKTYELTLELPAALRQKEFDLRGFDGQGGVRRQLKKRSHKVTGDTQILTFRPDLDRYQGIKVIPGATYTFSCLAKGEGIVGDGFEISGYFRAGTGIPITWYPPYIQFDKGSYDWKPFKVELKAPANAVYLMLIAIKWQRRGAYGTLYLDDLSLTCDKEPDKNYMLAGDIEHAQGMQFPGSMPLKPVPAPKPGNPMNLALCLSGTKDQIDSQDSFWLPMPMEPLVINMADVHMLPTQVFEVPADFKGKHAVRWSVLTDSKVALKGEVMLVPAPDTSGPRQIEFTIWLGETGFENMAHPIQEMYLKRLKRLGLNGIMPTIHEPAYEVSLDDINFTNWTAQWGRQNGMAVRPYLHFFSLPTAIAYCRQYPEYWAETWKGIKTPDYRVCLTHGLDGDKYDDKKTGVRGGRANLWLGRLCEAVKRSVKVNDLQGVYWDFEFGAVPVRRVNPKPYDTHSARQVCACLRCRRAFKDYAKLDCIPIAEELVSDTYFERWNDFKCWQHTRVWAHIREAAREVNPEADFRIYSGPPGAYSRQAYGVDWTIAAKVIDVAMSAHTPDNTEQLARSHYAASEAGGRRNPLLMSILINGYSMPESVWTWPLLPKLANQLMQTVIDWDAMGVALCGVWGFDSQFNASVREASAMFAKYEKLLTTGKHDDKLLSVMPQDVEYAAWQSADGRKIAGFFFNNSGEPLKVTVTKTGTWSKVNSTEGVILSGEKVNIAVPAWGRKVVEFSN
ncbi:MAG: carbohydrate binding domain-containing protein [bacterium]